MRAIVTGGFGFIGSYLCKELFRQGWHVKILDINNKAIDYPEFNNFEKIIGDIRDFRTVVHAFKDVDLVIHLAAKHRFFGISQDEFNSVNVDGTKIILEAMTQNNIKNFIFYSSVAVYGDQTLPTNENTVTNPKTPYGLTKLSAENLIFEWAKDNVDRSAVILRPTIVFGARNRGNMYRLIRQINNHLFIQVGNGKNIKSVAYVENLVDATLFLINKGIKGAEVYNYSDEPHQSFRKIVDLIYHYLGRSAPKYNLPKNLILTTLKPFDFLAKLSGKTFPVTAVIVKMNKSTHHLAKKIRTVGFFQKYSIEKGLSDMVKWYIDNRRKWNSANGDGE
jgi:GlcNAc-P-P-Und epimerase